MFAVIKVVAVARRQNSRDVEKELTEEGIHKEKAMSNGGQGDQSQGNRPTLFDFGSAIHYLRGGHKVTRKGWNGPGQYLELQVPDENSKMTLPYIYISTVQGDLVPWLASQTDMLATDWRIYA